ncbi:unnamed protein product [Closterium sp. Yama58-4]|nr:unnamed protein product [Closterium sp. Yama58-4]
MDAANLKLSEGLVSPSYVRQGAQSLAQRHNMDLSLMDSSGFKGNVGMGEREARCASGLVRRRHYGMTHGMGRSGNITDEQPKAAGSTLACRLTNLLVKDALSLAGLKDISAVTVLPVATGMALTLALLALKASRPSAQYVLWSRIDQKTCLKCIVTAGLTPVVVPLRKEGDQLCTDLAAMEREIDSRGAESILCVLSTTSCFAPRAPDSVESIARLCARFSVPHVINNAYGVQSAAITAAVTRAWRRGRVDAVVQSTDKNFLVPVGGSVVAAGPGKSTLVNAVNASYPGRASISPILDVLITLLSLGASGWQALLQEREQLMPYLREKMRGVAERHGEWLLQSPDNPISLAISLSSLVPAHAHADVACAAADSAPPAEAWHCKDSDHLVIAIMCPTSQQLLQ